MSISIIFPFGTIHSWHLQNYEFLAPSPCHYDTQSTYQNFYWLNYNQPLTSSVLEVIYGYDFLRDELGLILADKKEKREEKENIWEWHHPQMEIWIKNLHISDTFRELIEHLKDGSSNDSLKLNSLRPYWPQHPSLPWAGGGTATWAMRQFPKRTSLPPPSLRLELLPRCGLTFVWGTPNNGSKVTEQGHNRYKPRTK